MLHHSTLDYRKYVVGTAAAIAAGAAGGAAGGGLGLLRDYLNSRYEDNRLNRKFGFDQQLAQQQFGFNSALSAQSANQDQNLARLNSALRVEEDSGKYQRSVKDREAAGLNVGALGSGGFQSPTIQSAQANSTVSNFDPKDSVQRALVATAKKNSRAFSSALAVDQKKSRNAVVSALKK